ATAQYGNTNGGSPHDDTCPIGQVLVGFSGFLSSQGWHGRIEGLCGTLSLAHDESSYVVHVVSGATLPLRGDVGVTAWASTCATCEMVAGFGGRSGALVDQIALHCAPLLVTGGALTVGKVTVLSAVGDSGGSAFPSTNCPANQIVTTSRVRSGDSIDAF